MLLLLFVASHAIQPAPLSKWVLIFIIITSHWSVVVALVNALVECNWNKTGTKKYQENNDNSNHWWCAFLGWYGCHCLQSLKTYLHKQNQWINQIRETEIEPIFFFILFPQPARPSPSVFHYLVFYLSGSSISISIQFHSNLTDNAGRFSLWNNTFDCFNNKAMLPKKHSIRLIFAHSVDDITVWWIFARPLIRRHKSRGSSIRHCK